MERYQRQLFNLSKEFCISNLPRVIEIITNAKNYECGLIGILNVYQDVTSPHFRTNILPETDGRITGTIVYFE